MREESRALTAVWPLQGFLRILGWVGERAAREQAEHTEANATAAVRALSVLRPGECGVVCRVAGSGPIRQRLLELGVTRGAPIEVIRFAPLGDPIEVRVRGYHLSLRRREAEAIWVGREDRECDCSDATAAGNRRSGGQSE
jgi:Fe2+ transport system protein FeoA